MSALSLHIESNNSTMIVLHYLMLVFQMYIVHKFDFNPTRMLSKPVKCNCNDH